MPTTAPTPTEFSPAERRKVYYALTLVIPACWLIDIAVTSRLPLDTLAVRGIWAALFALAGFATSRLPAATASFIESATVGLSTLALAVIAALTGGVESPMFFMLPFLPPMVAQVEQTHAVSINVSTATVMATGVVAAVVGEVGLVFCAGWLFLTAFTGWWGRFWYLRMQLIRRTEVEQERALARAEADRAEALQALAQAQLERTKAEKLSLIGRLATGVAHEINNPLAFVKANLEYLREEIGSGCPEGLRVVCDESLVGAERIRQIVTDLRSFARDEPIANESVDVRAAIEEALRLASVRLKGLSAVCVDLAPELPPLTCNRGKLVQVLLNLLVNAADALERAPAPAIELGARTQEAGLQIWVEDNGPGVPAELAPRLFEPFFSTKPAEAGMGLGLALSQEYVRSLGGEIRLESRPGGGARFVIDIPVVLRAAA